LEHPERPAVTNTRRRPDATGRSPCRAGRSGRTDRLAV